MIGDSDFAAQVFGGKEKDWTRASYSTVKDGDGTAYRAMMGTATGYLRSLYKSAHNYGPQALQYALCNNPIYCRQFAARAEELFAENGPLSTAAVSNHVDRLSSRLRPAIFAEAARWGSYSHDCRSSSYPVYGLTQWEAEVTRLATTAPATRTPIFMVQLAEARLTVATMPAEDEQLVTPTPPPPPPPERHVDFSWTLPDTTIPATDAPVVSYFSCHDEALSVTVKNVKPGVRYGFRVSSTLTGFSTLAPVEEKVAENDILTFSTELSEKAESLYIQIVVE